MRTLPPSVLALVLAFGAFSVVGAGAGCGSSSSSDGSSASSTTVDADLIDSGITDVKSACTARTAWAHGGSGDCSLCQEVAVDAYCTCTGDPAIGRCYDQERAVDTSADCTTAVKTCLSGCTATDCSCEDSCLTGHDTCRALEGALAGCLVDVCTSRCNQ